MKSVVELTLLLVNHTHFSLTHLVLLLLVLQELLLGELEQLRPAPTRYFPPLMRKTQMYPNPFFYSTLLLLWLQKDLVHITTCCRCS